jgi:hypothetical protein
VRQLRQEESNVVEALLGMVPDNAKPSFDKLFAVDLRDGGMGSIRLTGEFDRPRKMGSELVTAHYIDEDQIPVIISINLDQEGRLFEIDFWKVDFSPLKRYPTPKELKQGQPTSPSSDGKG